MKKTYVEFVCEEVSKEKIGIPIYSNQMAAKIENTFNLEPKAAASATAVAFKRILDGKAMADLRTYQKGIYYRTVATAFGEMGINKEQLIADKYLLPDIGYETGPAILHRMGLTSQMPRERLLATNIAKNCVRADKKLGVMEEKEIQIPTYKVVSVFDLSQTEGKPLPTLANNLTGNVQQYEIFMTVIAVICTFFAWLLGLILEVNILHGISLDIVLPVMTMGAFILEAIKRKKI